MTKIIQIIAVTAILLMAFLNMKARLREYARTLSSYTRGSPRRKKEPLHGLLRLHHRLQLHNYPPIATYTFTYAPTAPFILCTFLMITAGIIFMKV